MAGGLGSNNAESSLGNNKNTQTSQPPATQQAGNTNPNNSLNNGNGSLPVFPYAYNSATDEKGRVTEIRADGQTKLVVKGGKSLFNRYAIFCLAKNEQTFHSLEDFRDGADGFSGKSRAGNRINGDSTGQAKKLTMRNIIKEFEDNQSRRYEWKDFAYCKHAGTIPFNRLLTLRRFLYPVSDPLEFPETDGQTKQHPPVAKALSFIGEETGNLLKDIMTFSVGYKWEDIESDIWETQGTENGFEDTPFFGALSKGAGGRTGRGVGQGVRYAQMFYNGRTTSDSDRSGAATQAQEFATREAFEKMHPNEIMGPIDVIDKTKKRGRGLDFEQSIKLRFEYTSRSLGDINPKVAMVDIISNFLALTYSYAPFWGGENRHFPQLHQAGFLGDQQKFYSGDYDGYFKSFFTDVSTLASSLATDLKSLANVGSADEAIQQIKKLAGSGAKFGLDLLSQKSRPNAVVMHGLISGAPVGMWHLTVGNPFNPIAEIGNLICTKTTFEFGEELGFDDFPTELIVTVELEHGRPRDGSEIQSMFNRGRGKIYRSIPQDAQLGNTSVFVGGNDGGYVTSGQNSNNGSPRQPGACDETTNRNPVNGGAYLNCLFNASLQGVSEGIQKGFGGESGYTALDKQVLRFGGLFGGPDRESSGG